MRRYNEGSRQINDLEEIFITPALSPLPLLVLFLSGSEPNSVNDDTGITSSNSAPLGRSRF